MLDIEALHQIDDDIGWQEVNVETWVRPFNLVHWLVPSLAANITTSIRSLRVKLATNKDKTFPLEFLPISN